MSGPFKYHGVELIIKAMSRKSFMKRGDARAPALEPKRAHDVFGLGENKKKEKL